MYSKENRGSTAATRVAVHYDVRFALNFMSYQYVTECANCSEMLSFHVRALSACPIAPSQLLVQEEEEGFYKFLPANTADRLCQSWQSCSNHQRDPAIFGCGALGTVPLWKGQAEFLGMETTRFEAPVTKSLFRPER